LFAPEHGVFEPMFKLGERVCAGQPAGRLFNPHAPWQAPRLLRFEADGMVVCIRSFTGVEPGDCIALSASDANWS
jgi:predicted deacylase